MDRRTFLSRSAVGSAAALAGVAGVGAQTAGCGGARPMLGAVESTALLTRLERGLAAIRDVPVGGFAMAIPWEVRPEHREAILRLGLESLVVADVNRSVPAGVAVPRELAERIAVEVPMLERTVGTYHAYLSRMPPAARRDLDRRVRERPEVTMEMAAWIDDRAAQIDVGAGSRALLRSVATNMGARMRRQSASAVIDDALRKVERAIAGNEGARAHAAADTTARMVDAVWQAVDGTSATPPPTTPGASALAAPGDYAYTGPSAAPEPTSTRFSERWARPGDEDIEIGAILMPFGLLTCTVLLWVGLAMVISGVNRNSAWDARATEAR